MKTLSVRTAQTSANGHGVADEVSHTLDGANGQAVCVGVPETSPPLMSGGNAEKSHGARSAMSKDARLIPEIVGTLSDGAHNGGGLNGQDACTGRIIPVPECGRNGSVRLGDGNNDCNLKKKESEMSVRRLTPKECERLQGFPDNYTLIPFRGKPASDGPRYKALGNSMAVPVMRWIGERIAMIDKL